MTDLCEHQMPDSVRPRVHEGDWLYCVGGGFALPQGRLPEKDKDTGSNDRPCDHQCPNARSEMGTCALGPEGPDINACRWKSERKGAFSYSTPI